MPAVKLRDIPYLEDSSRYYRAIRHLPQAIWLDSGRPQASFGRYDLLAAAPRCSVSTTEEQSHVLHADGSKRRTDDDPFALLNELLTEHHSDAPAELPFCGGLMGYFGYHLGQHSLSLPAAPRDVGMPDMIMGLYAWSIIQDHGRRKAWLVALPDTADATLADICGLLRAAAHGRQALEEESFSFQIRGLESNLDPTSYRAKLRSIHDYILAGDCYQVNFAQRFSAAFEGDSFAAYCRLRRLLPAPYAAYLETDAGAILSHSPERFLKLDQRRAETRPIKGTAPRASDPERDHQLASALQASSKDRAENLMIVDLLRNDLGKSCEYGSVRTHGLFELETYANVHHLVSTVSGRLRQDCTAVDLLRGCFPGGSITGAPKRRAMEIIAELEPGERSVYCGSIGYLSAHGRMDTNIAIRSLVRSRDRIYCWGGGGIVADSDPEQEYAESLTKVRILLDGLSQRSARDE